MKNITKLAILTCLIALCSCSNPPKLVAASDLCNEEYKNEIVMCEGIIRLPDSFYTTGVSVTMAFEAPSGKFRIPAISLRTFSETKGEKKNMMDLLPDGFTEEDVTIYDDNGKTIKLGDKIRVTGELVGASKAWCTVNVTKIEKVN